MRYLLDTCAVIWSADPDKRLTPTLRKILEDPHNEFSVSVITTGELACAQARKRLELPIHWKPWFRKMLEVNGWQCLPVSLEILEEAYSLPEPFHPDPADRIIVATARLHGMTVLTGDRKIIDYPHVKAKG
jgi:PIN domain nuclease of toxin-antitoxin system